MIPLRSRSAEETRAIAAAIAGVLQPGDVVALEGGLGAGKTAFVQGAAAALGSRAAVTSPTFAIVQQYADGPTGIHHVDAYRLDRVQELHDIGFDDLLDGTTITFVEWGDRVRAALPDDRLTVKLAMDLDAASGAGRAAVPIDGHVDFDTRSIVVEHAGDSWSKRDAQLRHALAPYTQVRPGTSNSDVPGRT